MKTGTRRSRGNSAAVEAAEAVVESVLPNDSRIFYRWLEERWTHGGRLEEEHPTRYLMEELDRRGEAIQEAARRMDAMRERLLEREVQLTRLEGEIAARDRVIRDLQQDNAQLQERFKRALQASTESRRSCRELEERLHDAEERLKHANEANDDLNAHVEELMGHVATASHAPAAETNAHDLLPRMTELLHMLQAADERVAAAERERSEESTRYREVFGHKDNRLRDLEESLVQRDARIHELEALLNGWAVRTAVQLGSVLRRGA